MTISAPETAADAVERYLNQKANAGDFIYERGDAEQASVQDPEV